MDESIQDVPEVLETPEAEIIEEPAEEAPEESAEDRIARLEKEKEELESKNKQLYARVKKEETKADAPSTDIQLSPKDMLALSEHKVSSQDFDEVAEYAKYKKVPIHEALQDKTLKTILETKAEERRTAQATSTGRSARGTTKVSGEDMLRKAETTGELPDSEEGMAEIIRAKMARSRSH